jgi:hypothetical protein
MTTIKITGLVFASAITITALLHGIFMLTNLTSVH